MSYDDEDREHLLGADARAAVAEMQAGTHDAHFDTRAAELGTLYIEFECRGRPSGIMVSTADYWTVYAGGLILTARRKAVESALREYATEFPGRIRAMVYGSHPTRGVCIPVRDYLRILAA